MEDHQKHLIFFVNGKKIELKEVDPHLSVADFLRNNLNLTGTKIGCNEGRCGSCTVMISDQDPLTNDIRHYSVNSCLTLICSIFGKAITTVEGITDIGKGRLHEVQNRLTKAHGSQCGFCTPGFVMAMYCLLRNNPTPSTEEIDEAIQGNLCRCTGYRPILEALYSFTSDVSNEIDNCKMGDYCCKKNKRKELYSLVNFDNSLPYSNSQEPIFPPLLLHNKFHLKTFTMKTKNSKWFQPLSIESLETLLKKYPNACIISGGLEVAYCIKSKLTEVPVFINIRQIKELRDSYIDNEKNAFYVGSGLSLSEVNVVLKRWVDSLPQFQTKIINVVSRIISSIGGKHVRNSATISGNLVTASKKSDLNTIWMAAGAFIDVIDKTGKNKVVKIDAGFFKGSMKTKIEKNDIIKGIWIPFSDENQYFESYKLSQKKDNDISIVNSAFSIKIENNVVTDVNICYGNVSIVTKMASETNKYLKGKYWGDNFINEGIDSISKEFNYLNDSKMNISPFKYTLVLSLFQKFCIFINDSMNHYDVNIFEKETKKFKPSQVYYDVPNDQDINDSVGKALLHRSGERHTTGEAIYAGDVDVPNCLYIALVTSPVAKGILHSVDISEAMKIDGVIRYFDKNDLPNRTRVGFGEEIVFAENEILSYGQIIGAIVATSHNIARKAVSRVELNITPIKATVTIDQAIERKSFFKVNFNTSLHSSLLKMEKFENFDYNSCDKVITGDLYVGSQEHMYLETNQVVVIPGEGDELEIISSTQGPSDVQREVADVLKIPRNRIITKVKRIGGGFGGKEFPSCLMAIIASLVAHRLKRNVKLILERYDDMCITGNRHDFKYIYKAALGNDNKLKSLNVKCYVNAGCHMEVSHFLLVRNMTTMTSAYNWENTDIYGKMCKTNISSNGSFRGFGVPQAQFCMEVILQHLAESFNIDVNKLREENLYREGEKTNYGMLLEQCNAVKCWNECLALSEFEERSKNVALFNEKYKYKKRGIYIVPTLFPVGFGIKVLSQAACLINVYTDGSVLISYGGVEMGQGLHTKMLQIASRCLNISIDKIEIRETRTDCVPNTTATIASLGSDLNGEAIKNACEILLKRLKPIIDENPNGNWEDWVSEAYDLRIPLSATGYGIKKTEDIDLSDKRIADAYGYCVYGAACSEVEIDCLTGFHKLLRSDVVMDIGDSLNPAIDIGQIEGGFMQGYGLYTMEKLVFDNNGIRITTNFTSYKIPSPSDSPHEFNVKLLKGSSNKKAIFSSKAVGEPPVVLGSSAFFAIKEAIKAYRKDNGCFGYFKMNSPATCEVIRMLCIDSIVKKNAQFN